MIDIYLKLLDQYNLLWMHTYNLSEPHSWEWLKIDRYSCKILGNWKPIFSGRFFKVSVVGSEWKFSHCWIRMKVCSLAVSVNFLWSQCQDSFFYTHSEDNPNLLLIVTLSFFLCRFLPIIQSYLMVWYQWDSNHVPLMTWQWKMQKCTYCYLHRDRISRQHPGSFAFRS